MQHFLESRRKAGDELVDIRKALWLTMTGRSPNLKPSTSPEQATSALLLLAAGQRDRARELAESARRTATAPAAVSFASSVLVLAQPSGTAETWRARISRAVPGPEQEAARRQLLGYALLLDGRFDEAAEVWREVYDSTPGLSVNEPRTALVWALTAAGHNDQARELMPRGFLPPAALDPGPNILLFRKAAELRQGRS
jgi:thioredoxin-like negative regulator of GroEL